MLKKDISLKEDIEDIDFEIRKNMTNGICLAGATLFSMKLLSKKKYVSKKTLNELIARQELYIKMIENSKNVILTFLQQ